MAPDKYRVHYELLYEEVCSKILELVEPYPDDVALVMIADALTQIIESYLTNAMDPENPSGLDFTRLMQARLAKISRKFFREKIISNSGV